ncbi:MAG: Anti-sigma-E factor RseA [Candidatus Celerinatantimonas neptuna]|nr:MAG: Anti-sigma-E factor RseA [Candidatus Celerinatantimonas neptuna]
MKGKCMVKDEQISALMDSELQDEKVLESFIADDMTHNRWQRYHLIGDVMRGDAPQMLNLDLSAGIAQALENEPAHEMSGDNDISRMRKANRPVPQWLKPLGQYAIAASVAVIAILGVQHYQGVGSSGKDQPLPVFNTVPIGGTISPVSLQANFIHPKQQLTEQQWLEQRREIAAYLQDHQLQQRHQD